jgi:hypothetical protein
MIVNQILLPNNENKHFNSYETNAQTKTHQRTSDLMITNVPNTHIRPAKQTGRKSDTEKSKTVQNSILNHCCFQ